MRTHRTALTLAVIAAIFGLLGSAFAQDQSATPPVTPPASGASVPTLFVVGDSTASNGANLGWGSHLGKYFDPAKINVVNRARGGRSSRTFQTEGSWDKVLAELKAGDFVLIQFGHNDGSPVNDTSRARGSLPGLGEETQEIDNLVTKKHEVVHTFGWYMRKFVADTKAKNATPILLSLTIRNMWTDGKVERGSGRFSPWAGEIAKAQNVAFVDLTNITADQYEMMGQLCVARLFPRDHTHTSVDGANLNAALVVAGLKAAKAAETQNLASLLSAEGLAVTPAGENVIVKQAEDLMTRPWMPDALPASDPNRPTLFCIGDSTVRTGRGDGGMGQWGWGAPIGELFDRSRINVENRAMGGTSSRTFQTLGLWDKVLERMKKGDYLILQFGHNDNSAVNDGQRARGTIKGNGEETQDVNNLLTGKPETVHTYGWYLRKYITDARAKGVTTIVCSPIPRNNWRDGKVARATEDYAKWASEAAAQEKAWFIDLNELIAQRYEEMGQTRVTALCFPPREGTHTGPVGAQINALCVVRGLKSLENCALVNYLKPMKK